MRLIDDKGRLLGLINIVDLGDTLFVCGHQSGTEIGCSGQ